MIPGLHVALGSWIGSDAFDRLSERERNRLVSETRHHLSQLRAILGRMERGEQPLELR